MKNTDSIFIKCECGDCSILEINAEQFPDEELTFSFALWANHNGYAPMSKKERIRWCDHVMKTGQPWADHTIVSKQNAKRIAEFINKKLNYGKNQSS